MLFKRKHPPDWREKTRIALWPRRSWARSGKYMAKRILRLTGSPHAIAAGVAAGVFSSFTPFMGLHFLIAFMLAYILAGNFLAAAMGTFFGNPISFPFIWTSTYSVGTYILTGASSAAEDGESGMSQLTDTSWFDLGFSGVWDLVVSIWDPVMKPMLVGSVPCGVPFAILAYVMTRLAANQFREARRRKILRAATRTPSIS